MTTACVLPAPCRQSESGVTAAIRALAAGELILLSHDRRVVLVGCADAATPERMAFMVRYSTGFLQVALHERVCDRLVLPEATPTFRSTSTPAHGQCVTVDATAGTTTGISGADRALTARVLADPATQPADLTRPGHLVPVRVTPDELRIRSTAASFALTLSDIAARNSGAVFADLEGIIDPTRMGDGRDANVLSERHGLTFVGAGDGAALH